MKRSTVGELNVLEGDNPSRVELVFVTDIPDAEDWAAGSVMSKREAQELWAQAKQAGVEHERCAFITCGRPADMDALSTDSKVAEYLMPDRADLAKCLRRYRNKRLILTMGKWGATQLFGRQVKITEARGTLAEHEGTAVLPLLSPREILKFPDKRAVFATDFRQVGQLRETAWDVANFLRLREGERYQWCLDLSAVIANPPRTLALDTETTGLDHRSPSFRVLNVQLGLGDGRCLAVPLDERWWNDASLFSHASAACPRLNGRLRARLISQLQTLLGNPEVLVTGHNLKFDHHALSRIGVVVAAWRDESLQAVFAADENMQRKGLDHAVRRWLPSHAGYADGFNAKVDKSKMEFVEHADFLPYACGDVDVSHRLIGVLLRELKVDPAQNRCYRYVQMPALRQFLKMERVGVRIDADALRELREALVEERESLAVGLMAELPPAVLRKHQNKLVLTRKALVVDALFGPDAMWFGDDDGEVVTPTYTETEDGEQGEPEYPENCSQLVPVLLTKGGAPSTSYKQHLAAFEHVGWIRRYGRLQKAEKMLSTYIGQEGREVRTAVVRLKNGKFPAPLRNGMLAHRDAQVVACADAPLDAPEFAALCAGKPSAKVRVRIGKKSVDVEFHRDGQATYVRWQKARGMWAHIRFDRLGHARIYPSFSLDVAVTGRANSRNPNGQNIPKRGPLAERYRRVFVPSPGYGFLEADLSQIELRIAAWMSMDRAMLDIYRQGGDIHAATASLSTGGSYEQFRAHMGDETPLADVRNDWRGAEKYLAEKPGATVSDYLDYRRFLAKAENFGFLYGMGWRKFRVYALTEYGIRYTEQEAQEVREAFFARYRSLPDWHVAMREFVNEHGYVRALHGALRRLGNVHSIDDAVCSYAERQGINSPVQRFGSDLGLIGCSRFGRDADEERCRILMFIHDANVAEVQEGLEEEYGRALVWYMENPPLLEWFNLRPPLPICADVAFGPNLQTMAKKKNWQGVKPDWFGAGTPDGAQTDAARRHLEALVRGGCLMVG